jgi:hypothetical protein
LPDDAFAAERSVEPPITPVAGKYRPAVVPLIGGRTQGHELPVSLDRHGGDSGTIRPKRMRDHPAADAEAAIEAPIRPVPGKREIE